MSLSVVLFTSIAAGAMFLFAFVGFKVGLFTWLGDLFVNHAIDSQMEVLEKNRAE